MWYIKKLEDDTLYSVYEFAGHQLLQRNINLIYYSIQDICDEDYKVLNNRLEEHILTWINNMASHTVELYVYNYGIDNAIILLNKFNNSSTTKKFTNTTSKNLLFALFYNKFSIDYIITPKFYRTSSTSKYNLSQIIIIQRVWRKRLAYKKKIKRETIENDFTYLIEKINKEITGEPSKRVLIYLVNKYRKRMSKTL